MAQHAKYATPAHQDGAYWLPRVVNGCTELGNAVLVLDDMTIDNGCLYYVHGSHKGKLRPHEDGVVGFSRALADWSEEDTAKEVPMLARRGDVIVHHCLTVHRAGVNGTPSTHRRSIGFSFSSVNVEMSGLEDRINSGRVVGGKLVQGQWDDRPVAQELLEGHAA